MKMILMKKQRILAVVLAAAALLSASCKSQYELMLESNDVPAKYKMAFDLLEAKKYSKAASMFESLKIAVKGTLQDDTVQYYAAYSHYMFGDVYAADRAFDSFVSAFPLSPFAPLARFLYLDCLYEQTYRYELDQTPTYRALGAIYEYMVDYPENEHSAKCKEMIDDLEERLDRKAYEAARLYYSIEDYKAATYALKNVLREDADNRYREDILYYVVISSYKYAFNSVSVKQRERYLNFTDEYYSFVTEFPDSEYRKELDGLANKVQKILSSKK